MNNISFICALKEYDKVELKNFPKADLHNHAIFSCDRNYLIENNIGLPQCEKINSIADLIGFARKYIKPLQNEKNYLYILLKGSFEKCLETGITVVDSNIDYKICINVFNKNVDQFIEFLREFDYQGLKIRWVIDISRDSYLDEYKEIILNLMETGFFYGIDLTSTENIVSNDKFKDIYNFANEKGLITKVHCGEQLGADYIKQCILDFNPKQIQHGINIVESKEVMGLAKEKDIIFNVCPTSNLILNYVKDIESHPIKRMVEFGLRVTIATDDFLFFGSDINDEYFKLYNNKVLSAEQLDGIRKFSLTL